MEILLPHCDIEPLETVSDGNKGRESVCVCVKLNGTVSMLPFSPDSKTVRKKV